MTEKIELLLHHGDLVGFIRSLMEYPNHHSNLSRKFVKGEHLTLEEYMKLEDKDPFYHTYNPEVRESYKAGIITATRAAQDGQVEYVSDDTLLDEDPICQGCYWFDKPEANPRRCIRADTKKYLALRELQII